MNLTLYRHAYLPECTLGWLYVGDVKFATIERPWLANPHGFGGRLRESCVPDALYHVRPHTSNRFPNTYALVNEGVGVYYQNAKSTLWGRTAILIHGGNRVRDVIGCIAVGISHGQLEGEHAVLNSQRALTQLRSLLKQDDHQLLIRPTEGTLEIAA